MAKSLLRIRAREMRSKGMSVKDIAKNLHVAKSTTSLWVRDIILSVKQLEKLKQKEIKGAELGRLRSAIKQKEVRLKLIEDCDKQGLEKLKKLSTRESLIAGIALYWAEGSKRNRTIELCNSDPKLINFMIKWLKKYFKVKNKDLKCTVGINEIHRKRENIVKNYWSRITKIPLTQFRKTSFKKAINRKVYSNYDNHFGTLSVIMLKPGRNYYRILGLINGLSSAG